MRAEAIHRKMFFLALAVLLLGTQGAAVEHPGVVSRDAECTTCHANKVTGKSVHSVMATSCTICHVASMRGDMMTVTLSMPKEKICSACHDEEAALRQHVPKTKGACVECHDAHSSDRRMLLLESALRLPSKQK